MLYQVASKLIRPFASSKSHKNELEFLLKVIHGIMIDHFDLLIKDPGLGGMIDIFVDTLDRDECDL